MSRIALLVPFAALLQLAVGQEKNPGYTDTPVLPDGFRVHGANRPRPAVVDPGPGPKTPSKPPADATVLFDGSNLDAWQGRKGEAKWKLVDGAMEVTRTGDIRTKQQFGDCQLHIEWMAPPPKGHSQGRGNSGVFFFGRYEVQVLDSFENPTYADGQAAALYGQKPPLLNVTRPPGQWNVYDIVFIAPRFKDDGTVASPARVTVVHNGVVVQLDEALLGPTAHKSLPKYKAHGPKGSIKLQDHGNPMRFRNIWIRPVNLERPKAKPAK
ncbi:MAG TPA: DUF1080 domain-containing protein [Planctomycetes bacterium]|nr:DUF1080 domain-containing protein [Planctomycetota bacterium]